MNTACHAVIAVDNLVALAFDLLAALHGQVMRVNASVLFTSLQTLGVLLSVAGPATHVETATGVDPDFVLRLLAPVHFRVVHVQGGSRLVLLDQTGCSWV